jgi:ABC-type transport system involved in cytochrome c biogenesis permease subunit
MSTPEKTAPPAGEEIHLPGGSLQPLGLSVGITIAIVGVTTSIVLVIAGVVLSIAVLYAWIRDARREFSELPAEHH